MAYQNFTLADLIAAYTETLRSLMNAEANYPGACAEYVQQIKSARSRRLALIGEAIDIKSTRSVNDVYRAMAS